MDDIWYTDGGLYIGWDCPRQGPLPNHSLTRPRQLVTDKHVLLTGSQGSGKSRRFLLSNIVSLPNWAKVIVDPKGELCLGTIDYLRRRGLRCLIIDPFDVTKRGSDGFNSIGSLEPGIDLNDDAQGLGEGLSPVESQDQPHWEVSGQDLIASAILKLVYEGKDASLVNVREMLAKPRSELSKEIREMMRLGKRNSAALYRKASRFAEIGSKRENRELDSIVSTVSTKLRWVDSEHLKVDLSKKSFDFRELREEPIHVFLCLPANRIHSHKAWLTHVLSHILHSLLKEASLPPVPILFMLDEASQLKGGGMEILTSSSPLLRGFGIKVLHAYQDVSLAQITLGRDAFTSFMANTGCSISFAPRQDFASASFLAELAGQKTGKVIGLSTGASDLFNPFGGGFSLSINQSPIPALLPQDLMRMPNGMAVIYAQEDNYPRFSFLPDPSQIRQIRKAMAGK